MGDQAELWRDCKDEMSRRKWDKYNRIQPEKQLQEAGYEYTIHNNGYHLRLKVTNKSQQAITVDFWPTTGLWRMNNGSSGRGVKNLIQRLNIITGKISNE
jgi:hypothetical protein